MNKDYATFSLQERDFRWQRVRQLMDKHQLDGLLVIASERLGVDHYLTNDRPGQHVIFPREGKMVGLAGDTQVVAQSLCSRKRGQGGWLDDIRVGWTGENLVDLLREKHLEGKRVGTVGAGTSKLQSWTQGGWVEYRTWSSIKESLPTTIFQDVTFDYILLMAERSDRDIASLRYAAAAGEEACKAIIEVTQVGATEHDVYAAGMCAFHKIPGVNISGLIVTSGHDDNYSWGRPWWLFRVQSPPPRVLEEGDIVIVEMFPEYGAMQAQLQLCIAIGKIHPDFEVCTKAARKAYEMGLAAVKPGAMFGEVSDAMERPVREIGGWHLTPMIHTLNPLFTLSSLALDFEKHIPEVAQQYTNIRGRERLPADDFVLKPGVPLEFEPNAQLGQRRINIGGTVLVTQNGAEEINKIPNNLVRVPAKG